MTTYKKDECPVCGQTKYAVIGKIKDENPPVSIPEGSATVRCKNCRLIYVNPMPYWDDDDFTKLYNDEYFQHLKEDAKWYNERKNVIPQKRFRRIEPKIKSDKRKLLEIGAGENAFMCRYLMSKGWDVTAQEPSSAFAEKLRKIDGIKIDTAAVKDLEGEYSLIYADSVLEHVPNPVEYYLKLAELLAPGGVLYTISPNEYSTYNF